LYFSINFILYFSIRFILYFSIRFYFVFQHTFLCVGSVSAIITVLSILYFSIRFYFVFQHTFLCVGSVLAINTVLSDTVCADLNHPVRATLFSSSILIIGISTAVQSLFGLRWVKCYHLV
jgi:hypothetical protein